MPTKDALPGQTAAAVEPAKTDRQYIAPPIQEALAEVYFRESQWDLTIPGQFYGKISEGYPHIEEQQGVQIGIAIGPQGTSATPTVIPDRSRFRSVDGSRIVQVAKDLLVFNRLRPYEHFDEWRVTFAQMLALYRELAKPSSFVRVGVRYLNKVVIPEDTYNLSKYFRLYPEVPDEIGSPFGAFLLRVQSHPPEHASHTLVTTFGSTETDEGRPAILLDLYDIIEGGESADLGTVDRLVIEGHDNISAAFENAITDEARALFEETPA